MNSRGRDLLATTTKFHWGGSKTYESIFNPVVAIWILNLYARDVDTVYDPFAGGGTRAIVAAKKGLQYMGVELRAAEVDAIEARLKANDIKAQIICGNSADYHCVKQIPDNTADMIFTCPPYYDLERYRGGEADLSMAPTYGAFLGSIQCVIQQCRRILKPGGYSCWVVGLHRSGTSLLPIPHDIARLHMENGWEYREEVVLNWNKFSTGAVKRVGNFERGNRFLIRNHEYLEVFINTK